MPGERCLVVSSATATRARAVVGSIDGEASVHQLIRVVELCAVEVGQRFAVDEEINPLDHDDGVAFMLLVERHAEMGVAASACSLDTDAYIRRRPQLTMLGDHLLERVDGGLRDGQFHGCSSSKAYFLIGVRPARKPPRTTPALPPPCARSGPRPGTSWRAHPRHTLEPLPASSLPTSRTA